MRAVLVNASDSLVERRRRQGIDKKDERWQGEWHFVNPPKQWHARLNSDLFLVLAPLARRVGLDPYTDNIGIFADPDQDDWRVPDQAYARPENIIDAGLNSAELVVEVHSPGDESHDKFGFYAARMVPEVLIVHEDRRSELYRLGDDGAYVLVADGSGAAFSATLDVTFTTVAGPRLRITWTGGFAEI